MLLIYKSFCFCTHYIRFGVCCLFITSTSGSTSNQNCSYIQNPNFPNAYGVTTAISFTVAKCSTGMYLFQLTKMGEVSIFRSDSPPYKNVKLLFIEVCGIRLDFETFTLASSTNTDDATTVAELDTFQITTVRFFEYCFSILHQ